MEFAECAGDPFAPDPAILGLRGLLCPRASHILRLMI